MREREIFQEALDYSDPAQRQAYLNWACGNDASLRARITARPDRMGRRCDRTQERVDLLSQKLTPLRARPEPSPRRTLGRIGLTPAFKRNMMWQRLLCIVPFIVLTALVSLARSEQPPRSENGTGQIELVAQKRQKKKAKPAPKTEEKPETKNDELKKEDAKDEAKKKDKAAPAADKSVATQNEPKLMPRDDRERAIALINRRPPEQRSKYLAILDIKDQDRLAKMALADSDALVRHSAVYTLTNQKLLAKVAWESQDETIQITAASRITGADQASLVKFFDEPNTGGVRGLVFDKLTDPSTLLRIAIGPDTLGSLKAANRLVEMQKAGAAGVTDTMFEDIALGAKHEAARRAAIRAVSSQAVLAKAAEDSDKKIRDAAMARLKELRGGKK